MSIDVLGISGSLRRGSYNTAAPHAARELAPDGMTIEIADLAKLPMYNADVEADEGYPPIVADLRERIMGADALLIATPEYNFSIPGVLKNAIDWASRGGRNAPINHKPAAIVGAGGRLGTVRAQTHLRQILRHNDLRVVNRPEVLIDRAREKFEDGRLTHETAPRTDRPVAGGTGRTDRTERLTGRTGVDNGRPGITFTRMKSRRLPMFPLGSVLFPHALLPLRVFEDRYLRMIAECREGDGEFGVVLIERGSEVGGGDQRSHTGTVARILRVADMEGGHLAVAAAGIRRIRVAEWMPDDPYPQAVVAELDDTVQGEGAAEASSRAEAALRRVLALYSELGFDVGDTSFRLDVDPCVASFQACAVAPTGPFDGQRLLEIDAAAERLALLADLLDDESTLLSARLSGS